MVSQPTLGQGLQDPHLMGELRSPRELVQKQGRVPSQKAEPPDAHRWVLIPHGPGPLHFRLSPSFIWPWAQPWYLPLSSPERWLGMGLPSLWAAQEACHGKGLIGALQVSAPESRAVLERKRENSLLTLHPKSCPGIKEKQA